MEGALYLMRKRMNKHLTYGGQSHYEISNEMQTPWKGRNGTTKEKTDREVGDVTDSLA
jgi:hypothetical protein